MASVLLLHSLIMNGGVHHALECADSQELLAAADGYAFFGFDEVSALLRHAPDDPLLSAWTEESERSANRRYEELVRGDSNIVDRFREVYGRRSEQFAPLPAG